MDKQQWIAGSDPMTVFQLLHCLFDVGVAYVLMSLAWETTQNASFRHSPQRRWAAIRRIAYAVMAMGFFARGMMIAAPPWNLPWVDFLSGLCITLPILFFLAVRQIGVVDQDHWLGFRNRRNGSVAHLP